jgi:hypothetical protein
VCVFEEVLTPSSHLRLQAEAETVLAAITAQQQRVEHTQSNIPERLPQNSSVPDENTRQTKAKGAQSKKKKCEKGLSVSKIAYVRVDEVRCTAASSCTISFLFPAGTLVDTHPIRVEHVIDITPHTTVGRTHMDGDRSPLCNSIVLCTRCELTATFPLYDCASDDFSSQKLQRTSGTDALEIRLASSLVARLLSERVRRKQTYFPIEPSLSPGALLSAGEPSDRCYLRHANCQDQGPHKAPCKAERRRLKPIDSKSPAHVLSRTLCAQQSVCCAQNTPASRILHPTNSNCRCTKNRNRVRLKVRPFSSKQISRTLRDKKWTTRCEHALRSSVTWYDTPLSAPDIEISIPLR